MRAAAGSFQSCRAAQQESYAPLREELSQIPNKPFVKYYQQELDQKEQDYSTYYYPFYAVLLTGECPDDPDYNAFIAKKKLSDEEYEAKAAPYLTYASYFLGGADMTEVLKAAALTTVNPAQKEWAMTQMMASMVSAGNLNGLEEGYDFFSDTVKNEDYLDQVYELCNNAMLLAPGADAPDIEFEDRNGFLFNLSDFFGQPIYIDLWASWCGPCCEEIPYLAKFVESLGDPQEITVLSISIDDNLDDWLGKLDEIDAGWAQFIATEEGQQSISNQYFVSSIPRFILIDADGKIASVNAPRPSTPNLLDELKALL
jgi:thiol-disulfide isomerase/thioredoxin